MIRTRGVILEIRGCDVAFATHAGAPAQWASQVRSAILEVPQTGAISVGSDEHVGDSGGMTVDVHSLADLLTARSSGDRSLLDGGIDDTDTDIDVGSASDLGASGGGSTVWIGP